MVMHARSGGSLEVMGLMQGKIAHETFVVMDAFPLPVEGTETRVNAHEQAYEYMAMYSDVTRHGNRKENVVGWYHSHPGYGCWLSGIDVATEANMQRFMDPFLAVVVDPERTISAGKVDIGAFRTYPDGHKPSSGHRDDEFRCVPLSKIAEFGAHASRYYPLEVTHFKSTLDTRILEVLWDRYWVATITSSPLLKNHDFTSKQMQDLARRVSRSEGIIAGKTMARLAKTASADRALQKVVKESNKIMREEISGRYSNLVKEGVFSPIRVVEQAMQMTMGVQRDA